MKTFGCLPAGFGIKRDDRVGRFEPLDDHPLKLRVSACFWLPAVSGFTGSSDTIARRYLYLQAAQPHLRQRAVAAA